MISAHESSPLFEAEKEMMKFFSDTESDTEVGADTLCGAEEEDSESLPFSVMNPATAQEGESTPVPNFRGESVPETYPSAQVADVPVNCLARVVVAAVLSSVALKMAHDGFSSGSSDGSDEFLFFDPAVDVVSDDSFDMSDGDFMDLEKSRVRVLDQIHGKMMKVSDAAHRNVERVAEVMQQNMKFVTSKSKAASFAAKAKSERFQEALPLLTETPNARSQVGVAASSTALAVVAAAPFVLPLAVAVQSERVQKGVHAAKEWAETSELACETREYVKGKTEMVKDAAHAVYATMSDKAHRGYAAIGREQQLAAEIARETVHDVSSIVSAVSMRAHSGLDLVKEKAEVARGRAHSGLDLVKEKAEVARGKAHAVSTTVSEKAHAGYDFAKDHRVTSLNSVNHALRSAHKEKAQSICDGNCMQSVNVVTPQMPFPVMAVAPIYIIRQRGGA